MKYWCEDCKEVLDEDELVLHKEGSEAWGHTVYEEWWICPNCGHVPAEYDNQDKTCEDCVLCGTDACTYGEKQKTICSDFIGEDD